MTLKFKNLMRVSPSDVQDNDAFALKVVAVALPGGFWRAYRGPSDWSDERVAAQGDLLLEEQAGPLFYVLRASGRRYEE